MMVVIILRHYGSVGYPAVTLNNASDYRADGLLSDHETNRLSDYQTVGLLGGIV